MTKTPGLLLGLALLGGAAIASAQPTGPAGAPAPPPDPATEPAAVEPVEPVAIMEPPPEEPPPAPEAESSLDWDKGFLLESKNKKGDFEMRIKLRIESLWDLKSTKVMDDRTTDARFQVERGRIELEGHAFTKKLQYKFQSDYGKGFLVLKDFWFEGEVSDKIWVRSGQWKRPYMRQQMTSSGKLELYNRAITDEAFRGSRDIGVAVHNGYEGSPEGLEWVVGIFNGTGDKAKYSGGVVDDTTMTVSGGAFSNVPKSWMPMFVARVAWNKGGIKGYSEADLEGGPLRYSVGVSVIGETDWDRDSKRTHQAELDGIMKMNGLSVSAGLDALSNDDLSAADADTKQLGFHLQVGKVIGEGTKRMQPVGRFALVKPDGAAPIHEILVGFNWLPYGHNCKVMFDMGTTFDTEIDQKPFDVFVATVKLAAGMF
jgi:hypothetical protein